MSIAFQFSRPPDAPSEPAGLLTCPICAVMFISVQDLKEHLNSHDQPSQNQCRNCFSKFQSRDELMAHVKGCKQKSVSMGTKLPDIPIEMEEFAPKKKQIKCKYCGLLFSKNRDCIDHKHDAHPEMYTFKCKICVLLNQPQATYDEEHLLINHINLSHKIPAECFGRYEEEFVLRNQQLFKLPKPSFTLTTAPTQFPAQKTDTINVTQPPTGQRTLPQEPSGQVVAGLQQNAGAHVVVLTTGLAQNAVAGQLESLSVDNPNRTKCRYCDKWLSNPKFAKIHERQEHKEQFGFKCPRCDYVFENDKGLKDHQRSKHPEYFNEEAVSEGFCCYVCNNFYMTAAHLHAHQRAEHPQIFQVTTSSNKFDFTCPVCSLTGQLVIEEMIRHLKSHLERMTEQEEHFIPADQEQRPYTFDQLQQGLAVSDKPTQPQERTDDLSCRIDWNNMKVNGQAEIQ